MSKVSASVIIGKINQNELTKKRKDLEGVLNQYKKIKENEKKTKKEKIKLEKELKEKDEILKQKDLEIENCEKIAEEEFKKKNK